MSTQSFEQRKPKPVCLKGLGWWRRPLSSLHLASHFVGPFEFGAPTWTSAWIFPRSLFFLLKGLYGGHQLPQPIVHVALQTPLAPNDNKCFKVAQDSLIVSLPWRFLWEPPSLPLLRSWSYTEHKTIMPTLSRLGLTCVYKLCFMISLVSETSHCGFMQ